MIIISVCDYNNFSDEVKKQLCIIDKSEMYIIFILGSVILSLFNIKSQRSNLINSICYPDNPEKIIDTFKCRIVANLLTSCGLVFFLCIAKQALKDNTDASDCSPSYNYVASILVTFAGFIRLFDILYSKEKESISASSEETPENIEENILSNE